MDRNLPIHIEKLYTDLESGVHPESAFLAIVPALSRDITLLHLCSDLGYNLSTQRFASTPSAAQLLSLLTQAYALPAKYSSVDHYLVHSPADNFDPDSGLRQVLLKTFNESDLNKLASSEELGFYASNTECFTPKPKKVHHTPSTHPTNAFLTPKSLVSTPFSELEETPQTNKGLRFLTSLIKQIVPRGNSTSFKDVASRLIDELVDSEGTDRLREERNVRRRAYDALNVLIAGDVLERNGRFVSWKQFVHTPETQAKLPDVQKVRQRVDSKRKALREVLNKYLALRRLIDRNSEEFMGQCALPMPFKILATEDTENSIAMTFNASFSSMTLKCRRHFELLDDLKVLLALDLHKLHPHQSNRYLPSRALEKYVSSSV